jgi:hypothetical protein
MMSTDDDDDDLPFNSPERWARDHERWLALRVQTRAENEALPIPVRWHPSRSAEAGQTRHIVVEELVTSGRIRRTPGQILCRPSLIPMSDPNVDDPGKNPWGFPLNCPACLAMMSKLWPKA